MIIVSVPGIRQLRLPPLPVCKPIWYARKAVFIISSLMVIISLVIVYTFDFALPADEKLSDQTL
jgi:hypothetical protein